MREVVERKRERKKGRKEGEEKGREGRSVDASDRRNTKHLAVKSVKGDVAVSKTDLLAEGVPREGVFHPLLVVAGRKVVTSVGTATLLAVGGGNDGLKGVCHQVLELKCLDEVRVPDEILLVDHDEILHLLLRVVQLFDSLLEHGADAEDGGVALHHVLHL